MFVQLCLKCGEVTVIPDGMIGFRSCANCGHDVTAVVNLGTELGPKFVNLFIRKLREESFRRGYSIDSVEELE